MKNLFRKIRANFSNFEFLIIGLSLTISLILTLVAVIYENPSYKKVLQPLFPTVVIRNSEGSRVYAFDTEFYVSYENTNENMMGEVRSVLDEYLVTYHKYFDRHNEYYAVEPVNPARPTLEEYETLPRLHNLHYLNTHLGEKIEIAFPLFDILTKGKDYSLNTPNNTFSLFIGSVYDFWKPHTTPNTNKANDPLNNEEKRNELERLTSFIPLSQEDINSTLILEEENGKYYATLNAFNGAEVEDFSISLGALGKGYMADVLKEVLTEKGLVNGLIYAGASTITFLKNGIYGEAFNINMANIIVGEEGPSFSFSRRDQYQMSTSGIYGGFTFVQDGQKIIRSHILNPQTGYPAQNRQQLVSVVSNTLSGLELDYLTTTLTVLTETEGITFLQENYQSEDINYIFLGENEEGYYARRSEGFPGGNTKNFTLNNKYLII